MENHRERNQGKVISGAPLYRHRLDRGLLLFHPFDLYHHLVLNPFQYFFLGGVFIIILISPTAFGAVMIRFLSVSFCMILSIA
jgi:hypothetical protein